MKPSILIDLDRPRNIRLNINALVKVEEVLGKPISEVGSSCGVKEIRALLWAGLLHEDSNLTLDLVGTFIDQAGLENVAEKINEALSMAMGITADKTDPK